jgi:hypothetical protein
MDYSWFPQVLQLSHGNGKSGWRSTTWEFGGKNRAGKSEVLKQQLAA